MKHHLLTRLSLASCLLAGALFSGESRADTVTREVETYGTNWPLFHSGVWTFAGTYIPSLVVSQVSPHEFDRSLAIPVAGPWIDLANRDCQGCDLETLNRVLLVGDGILQSVGVVKIIGSLFFWERRVTTVASVEPSHLPLGVTSLSFDIGRVGGGNNYGPVARGTF
jgi:hypothetical protein